MIVCRRISTFSCSAAAAALRSGRTLKPMTMAFEAAASSTSDSLMAPTPAWMTRIVTLSVESFSSVSRRTSAEPLTSALRMIGSSVTSPAAIFLMELFERDAAGLGQLHRALFFGAVHDDLLGLGGIGNHLEVVARFGQLFQTEDFDRHGRPDFLHLLAAIVEHGADAAEDRAADEVIADTQRAVANQDGGHRTAAAIELGFEHARHGGTRRDWRFRSCSSATSRIISSSRSRFSLVRAETGTMTVSPPQSSASRPRSESCCLMRSTWASALSILLMATMIGTLAARA